jgi:putative tryptophan/tyrosine transport system substrate-binding protein
LPKELLSYTPRIAVLGNPAISTYVAQVREVQAAAHALGVELYVLEVRSPTEFKSAFATMLREGAGALVVLPDGGLLLDRHHSDIAAFALQSRLPAMYPWCWYVDAGGLMSYAPRMPDLQRRAATYVVKILKGAKPADLSVEQPTKVELVINLTTAQALGLTIPPSLLFQADEVLW